MTIRIVTDSACDLPQHLIAQHKIIVVPLTIRFGETDYIDGEDFTPKEFWAKCTASPVLPETAAPSPGQFEAAYRRLQSEGATGVLVVSLSSGVSATMQSAELAARAVAPAIDVRIVDSRNASMGLGLTVLACAELAATGASADEVVARAQSVIPRTRVFAALDTLDNLKKGGRIGGAKAMLATVMSIKPLISITNGLVAEAGKQRTRSKALAHLVDILRNQEVPIERLSVLNAQCSDVDAFVAMVKEVYSGEIIIGDIGAVIGTHAGQGTIGIVFLLSA